MQNENPDVLPALPVEYYEQVGGPWLTVIRWAAWAAIVYAVMTIASNLLYIAYYLMRNLNTNARTLFSPQAVLVMMPGLASAGLLLAGAIITLRPRRKHGRSMLLWACAAFIASSGIQGVSNMFIYTTSGNTRSFGIPFVVYQYVAQLLSMLRNAFFPTMLILLLCRREVKESCGT